jgi:stage V sporulation protein G
MAKAPITRQERESANDGRTVFDALVVTNVQVYLVKEPKGKIRAYSRAILNSQLQLTNLRVVEGEHGLFVSYPLDPLHKGEEFQNVYYPITRELKDHIEQCVLEKYHEINKV